MSKDNIWNVSRIRVPARSGDFVQMINAYDETVRLSAFKLGEGRSIKTDEAIDLDQFSGKITANLPVFLPVKPHRSGLHDNDNAPSTY